MSRRSVLACGAVLGLVGLVAACSAAAPAGSPGATSAASTTSATSATTPGAIAPPATPTSPSEGRLAQPVGLIAVQAYEAGDPSVFTSGVYTNASISGVAPRVDWQEMEPSAGDFDWQITDQVFAQAAASHKFVVLILVPGFDTPTWALPGVATATFARQYGPGAGQVGALPLPWDQTYLTRWFAFLQAVADRYGNDPAFRMIAAAGPTSVSVEMSLPNGTADLARWMTLGYTPDRYVVAWQTVFQAYARIFPRQYISLALYPGLPLGTSGTRDASQTTATPPRVLAAGLAYRAGFALQTSGLAGARTGSDLYNLVRTNGGTVVTGFQLTTSATNDPGQMGDAASPLHALALTLQLGVAAHVDFLEVYEADVVNPVMQGLLQTTAATLPH